MTDFILMHYYFIWWLFFSSILGILFIILLLKNTKWRKKLLITPMKTFNPVGLTVYISLCLLLFTGVIPIIGAIILTLVSLSIVLYSIYFVITKKHERKSFETFINLN